MLKNNLGVANSSSLKTKATPKFVNPLKEDERKLNRSRRDTITNTVNGKGNQNVGRCSDGRCR